MDKTDAQTFVERGEQCGGIGRRCVFPLSFSVQNYSPGAEVYVREKATRLLLEFFESKGLGALKVEDRQEAWYKDWLAYQAKHGLYAAMLSPQQYSTKGGSFDLLRYARFLEVFAYCSPAHGYSLQVSFLGLFAILMGSNESMKREALTRLEQGELLGFGVSERDHGSDLLANEFRITASESEPDHLFANGSKYYIGNANAASIIAVLGRKEFGEKQQSRVGRAPFILVPLRPQRLADSWKEQKIHTLGVRAAHVGAFDVKDYCLSKDDIIAEGRAAWDAVFGTVTLGKFFLGFGTIGMCEHAFHEAAVHLKTRTLYGKPVLEMPHIRFLMSQAYCRLLAMKLYAYRTLDYLHAASVDDRRYQFFCAVQKAKVSTEGVKVMALLSEAIGAKGFEGDTYFEMALRDVALIPGLEGSMHINLGLAAQLSPGYFKRAAAHVVDPPSLLAEEAPSRENPYLMSATTGNAHGIGFKWFLDAYRGLASIPNVALFIRQAAMFRQLLGRHTTPAGRSDTQMTTAVGHCVALIAYGELMAENVTRLRISTEMASVMFSLLVADMNAAADQLALVPSFDTQCRGLIARMIRLPRSSAEEWSRVAEHFSLM